MSNSLITLAILTAVSGGAFAAAFMSDPCASPCGSASSTGSGSTEPGTGSELVSIDYDEPCFDYSEPSPWGRGHLEASPSPGTDRRLSSEVWSGGSDTGSCIPETGRRRNIGSCTETECSINEVAYKDDDDNCKVIDVLPCEPEKPVIAPRESTTSVAIMDEDELQDRRSGCIPVRRPPPPQFTLACYSDGRGDESRPGWSDHDERYYPPWNDRYYDISGDIVDPSYVGPCFDCWGNFIDVQTPLDRRNCI